MLKAVFVWRQRLCGAVRVVEVEGVVGEGLKGAVLPWLMLRQDRSGEDQHGSRVVRARHVASGEDVVGVLLTIDEGGGALNGAQAVGSGGGSRMDRVES